MTARHTVLSAVSLAACMFVDSRLTDPYGSNFSLDISSVFETMACLFVRAFGDDSSRVSTIVSSLLRANSGVPNCSSAFKCPPDLCAEGDTMQTVQAPSAPRTAYGSHRTQHKRALEEQKEKRHA